MIRVVATGTFDILHPGHIFYLKKSRELGDELVVIVARDINVRHKPKAIIAEAQRLKMVQSLKMVDLAVLGEETDTFLPIEQLRPDIITLGYNQHFDPILLSAELSRRGLYPRIIRIESCEQCDLCSSSSIISKVMERYQGRRI